VGVVPVFSEKAQQPARTFFVTATTRPAHFLKTSATDLKIF
jgi:hypothetical protein